MKFENKGKWVKEAEEKALVHDNMENPDYLDGNNEVLTFTGEEDEFDGDILNDVEEDLNYPEEDTTDINEGFITKKKFEKWNKIPQVKDAIAKVDKKRLEQLMDEFTKMTDSNEEFPPIAIKNGKLVFALTNDEITIDSIAKEWFADEYIFESAQKNEAENFNTYSAELKKLTTLISAGVGRYTPTTTKEAIQGTIDALGYIAIANYYVKIGNYDNAVRQLKQASKVLR